MNLPRGRPYAIHHYKRDTAAVAWNYGPEAHEPALQCLKAPFFLSASDADAKIRSLVEDTV